jgi:sugar lactone lactonase YvrE
MRCHAIAVTLGIVLGAALDAAAQQPLRYRIETIAGKDRTALPDGLPASKYAFDELSDVTVGPDGVLYLLEGGRSWRIRSIDAAGALKTRGTPASRPCMVCELVSPRHMAVDQHGTMFISDVVTGSVQSVRPDGSLTTIVRQTLPARRTRTVRDGTAIPPEPAQLLSIGFAAGLAVDARGALYVVDRFSELVWRIAGNEARVVAGTGVALRERERRRLGRPAVDTPLDNPADVAVDRSGNLYIYEGAGTLLRVDAKGRITDVAAPATYSAAVDRRWNGHVEIDANDNVLFSDGVSIRRLSTQGVCTVVLAGLERRAPSPWCGEPVVIDADYEIGGFAVMPNGTLVFVDGGADAVYALAADGRVTLVAGRDAHQREVAIDDIQFVGLSAVAVRGDGALLVADDNGTTLLSAGRATRLELQPPANDPVKLGTVGGIRLFPDGTLAFTDNGNFRVFTRAPGGQIVSVAGVASDASAQPWSSPHGLARGPDGSFYVADSGGERVVRVSPDGRSSIFAGTGWSGYTGDDGPATRAQLSYPVGVAVDANGAVYIADTGNDVVRKVDSEGTITTLASGMDKPQAVVVDASGLVIVADTNQHRVVAIEQDGTMRVIAGSGEAGFSGDGMDAREAELETPCALDIAPDGTIYVADCGNGAIRTLVPF